MFNKYQPNMAEQTRPNNDFIPETTLSIQVLTMARKPQSVAKTGLTLTPLWTMDKIIGRFHLIAVKPDIARSIGSPKCFSRPLASLKSVQKRQINKVWGEA